MSGAASLASPLSVAQAHSVALGLGSNLGDRQTFLRLACEWLEGNGILRNLRCSRLYESPAMLPENAPMDWNIPYLNAVVVGETSLTPQTLLREVKAIEQRAGRQDRGRWGPRELDVDILLYGNLHLQELSLTLPHQGMHERDFVLLPLAELWPETVVPNRAETVTALASRLENITAQPVGFLAGYGG